MAKPVDFPKYLQFLVESYQEKQHLYTLTDLQVEVREEMPPQEKLPFPAENKPETKIDRLEVLAGLRKYVQQGNVLLLGKPGSGKSTVLQRFRWELAREALEKADRLIPVLVQLKYDESILEAICAEFENAQLNVSPEEVNDLRVRGKLLLLLDGVNEIPSQKRRQELQRFHDKNSHTRMIFTTRDLALGGSLGIEKKLEMCALTEAQMREFVSKYLPQHGDLLLRQLGNRLREVAETPLLLVMMCQVFENSGKIPQSKGELFQEFDRQYDEFKGAQSVSEDFRRFKSDLLQQLAFVMLQGDSQRPTDGWVAISRDRAEGILECWLRDKGVLDAPTKAKEWLEDLLEHHLLQVAAKREEIEFHHQLFQEYYAGRALRKLFDEKHSDATGDRRLQHFYLNYFKWTEPLAFMLSLLADEVQAVRVVRLALDVDLMLGARLAGEVQREFQQRAVGLVDGLDVPGWLKVALLGEVRSDAAIPGLLKLVEHSNSDVRRKVPYALGKIGSEAAVEGLLKLVEYSDLYVRKKVADALAKIGFEAAIPGLFKRVENSEWYVRKKVADALGKIGSEAAIPGLLKLLEDADSDVRNMVVDALGKITKQYTEKVVSHLPHLLTLIPSESGKEVHRLILAIQAACEYYNYSIRQLSLTPQPAKPPQLNELLAKIDQTTQQIHNRTKQMADKPTQDFTNATFQSLVNFGTNNGNQAQNLHIPAQQSSPEAALNAVVQIIQALEKKYTYVQDEQQALNIIDAEFKEIKEQKPIEWQNLISVKRLCNGGKKAAVKVGEHFTESNPWGKGLVAFIEGVSEEVK
ncbi:MULTISPECIES: HEAT repeat domain-containing protein [unclassified Microcoleus]|uniref:NACHT domain-containing protein n=1 Tax=unclassified Microcoleus TaxID=2642155 RepID=UPI002FD70468